MGPVHGFSSVLRADQIAALIRITPVLPRLKTVGFIQMFRSHRASDSHVSKDLVGELVPCILNASVIGPLLSQPIGMIRIQPLTSPSCQRSLAFNSGFLSINRERLRIPPHERGRCFRPAFFRCGTKLFGRCGVSKGGGTRRQTAEGDIAVENHASTTHSPVVDAVIRRGGWNTLADGARGHQRLPTPRRLSTIGTMCRPIHGDTRRGRDRDTARGRNRLATPPFFLAAAA